MHVALADRPDAAATPDVVHALVKLAGAQAEPGLPPPGHAQVRGDLQNAADVEHNRLDGHDKHDAGCPRGKVESRTPDVSAETPCAAFHKLMAAVPGNDAADLIARTRQCQARLRPGGSKVAMWT